MSPDPPAELADVSERLRSEDAVPGLLGVTARALVEVLSARGCTISRVMTFVQQVGERLEQLEQRA